MRISEEEILMESAILWSKRSTCSRLSVGSIISRNGRILSSGYNGAAAGLDHCEHVDDTPCKVAVHAEANAIIAAARHGLSTQGATMYVTHCPCTACASMIINAGINVVVFQLDYRSRSGVELLQQANIHVRKYNV